MHHVAAFIRLARPTFLIGGFAAFGLGAAVAAYAGTPINPALYVAGQTMVTAFQLMTHFANDYFDFAGDRYGHPTAFAGGSGVLVSGTLQPRTALIAGLVCAAIGFLACVGLGWFGRPLTASIGLAIGALAWSYSAPPLRLATRGWGELDTALVVAILVPLAGYSVFSGGLDAFALRATLAPACAMFAMMIAVEWPDRATDARANKQNLIVRLGARLAARLAVGSALLIVPAMFFAIGCGAPRAGAIFAVLLVPLLFGFTRRFTTAGSAPTDLAGMGVTVFFLTVVFELFGYVTIRR